MDNTFSHSPVSSVITCLSCYQPGHRPNASSSDTVKQSRFCRLVCHSGGPGVKNCSYMDKFSLVSSSSDLQQFLGANGGEEDESSFDAAMARVRTIHERLKRFQSIMDSTAKRFNNPPIVVNVDEDKDTVVPSPGETVKRKLNNDIVNSSADGIATKQKKVASENQIKPKQSEPMKTNSKIDSTNQNNSEKNPITWKIPPVSSTRNENKTNNKNEVVQKASSSKTSINNSNNNQTGAKGKSKSNSSKESTKKATGNEENDDDGCLLLFDSKTRFLKPKSVKFTDYHQSVVSATGFYQPFDLDNPKKIISSTRADNEVSMLLEMLTEYSIRTILSMKFWIKVQKNFLRLIPKPSDLQRRVIISILIHVITNASYEQMVADILSSLATLRRAPLEEMLLAIESMAAILPYINVNDHYLIMIHMLKSTMSHPDLEIKVATIKCFSMVIAFLRPNEDNAKKIIETFFILSAGLDHRSHLFEANVLNLMLPTLSVFLLASDSFKKYLEELCKLSHAGPNEQKICFLKIFNAQFSSICVYFANTLGLYSCSAIDLKEARIPQLTDLHQNALKSMYPRKNNIFWTDNPTDIIVWFYRRKFFQLFLRWHENFEILQELIEFIQKTKLLLGEALVFRVIKPHFLSEHPALKNKNMNQQVNKAVMTMLEDNDFTLILPILIPVYQWQKVEDLGSKHMGYLIRLPDLDKKYLGIGANDFAARNNAAIKAVKRFYHRLKPMLIN